MLFVKVDELKPGMRLGKPIYNKNGVLLYDRDTKLTMQAIYGIKNFRLLGLYILEPAEPVPPMILTLSVSRRWQFLVSVKIWI
jgi:hypothetical protein